MVKTWMKLLLGVLSFSLAGLASAAVSAEEIKVGVVDMQKALQTVDTGKKARSDLEKDFNAKKKELTTEEAAIKKMGEEYKKQMLVMNDDARRKKEMEMQDRVMKFQANTARSQAEIQRKEQELTQPIVTKLRTIIGDVAKQKGLAMVLEKNENMVLFSLEKDDLTAEVIAAYNKQAKN